MFELFLSPQMKNLIKNLYKRIIYYLFFLIYGKVFFTKHNSKIISKQNIKVNKFDYVIYRIKNARVFTNYVETLAVISKTSIIKEVSFQQIKGRLFKSKNEVFKTGTPKILKKFPGKMLILTQGASGHFNYAHWLLDIIPKIKLFSLKNKLSKIDFFYFSKLTKFQFETLKLLKIDPNKIIDAKKFRHVQAEFVYAVTHPNYFNGTIFKAHSNLPSWIIKFLRTFFLKKVKKKFNYENIYIDRNDSTQIHCKPINNYEITKFLKSRNFKILRLSNYSVIDQVSIFNNCKKVIAAHGAGLANIAFCKKGTKVIELIPSDHPNRVYKRISSINKLNYRLISCKKIKNDEKGDMFIDLNNLKKYV